MLSIGMGVLVYALCGASGVTVVGRPTSGEVGDDIAYSLDPSGVTLATDDKARQVGLHFVGHRRRRTQSVVITIVRDDTYHSVNRMTLRPTGAWEKNPGPRGTLWIKIPKRAHRYHISVDTRGIWLILLKTEMPASGITIAPEKLLPGKKAPPEETSPPPPMTPTQQPSPEPTPDDATEEKSSAPHPPNAPELEHASHGQRAKAPPRPATGTSTLTGYDGGFVVSSPDGGTQLKQNGRLQLRQTAISSAGASGRRHRAYFSIPRAYVVFKGHVLDSRVAFKFEINFGRGFVYLKDGFLDVRLVPKTLVLRAGQWKKPFSRQLINSSGRLQLAERSITNDFFATGRDIGVALHNDYRSSPPLEWVVGIFNGAPINSQFRGTGVIEAGSGSVNVTEGQFSNIPPRAAPLLAGRIGRNFGGIVGYEEPDLEGGARRIAIGASAQVGFDLHSYRDGWLETQVDALYKERGLSASAAFYFATEQSGSSFADQSGRAIGYHAQTGYLLRELVEPVARFGQVYQTDGSLLFSELSAGANLYFAGHDLKWVTDVSILGRDLSAWSSNDIRLRSQLQLAF